MRTAPIDSSYAWLRLATCLGLTTVGSAGMFVVVVALPAFQADYALTRAGASVPYTMVMAGFGAGSIIIGKIVDRLGVVRPIACSAIALALSYLLAGWADAFWLFNLAHVFIGFFGCAAVFAPLVADISKWFTRRRGLAVAICACGNYVAGALWPPMMIPSMAEFGWRGTYMGIGVISVLLMLPMLLLLRRQPEGGTTTDAAGGSEGTPESLGLSPNSLLLLLCAAGVGCCVAMAMPQVHIVSLCGDRGYGVARGAQMLALMLGFGIVSRLGFGWISDRLGGFRTILIGSGLQAIALLLFLAANSLTSLYVVAALFGLFQGGIVPCYALIVREYFPESEAGGRLGIIILSTLVGMAFGGWVSGAIYDLSGAYSAAFINGFGWNLLNLAIVLFLLSRARGAKLPGQLAAGRA